MSYHLESKIKANYCSEDISPIISNPQLPLIPLPMASTSLGPRPESILPSLSERSRKVSAGLGSPEYGSGANKGAANADQAISLVR
jgi:hypothetical protein